MVTDGERNIWDGGAGTQNNWDGGAGRHIGESLAATPLPYPGSTGPVCYTPGCHSKCYCCQLLCRQARAQTIAIVIAIVIVIIVVITTIILIIINVVIVIATTIIILIPIIITIAIVIIIIVHPPGARRPTKVYSIDYNDYVYMDR